MARKEVDVLVVGAGFCGLAIAIAAARRGLAVRCVGDGRPGASLANFGQLHSGAVYAPVLPDVAQACWQYRDRWHDLAGPARIGMPHGYALFDSVDSVERYQAAWQRLSITATEIDPRIVGSALPAAAAFSIPDYSVHLPTLHHRLADLARASGVVTEHDQPIYLPGDLTTTPATVVLATGAHTPVLLSAMGLAHDLRSRRIVWGQLPQGGGRDLTYWLDGDLLALSPDREGIRAGLPSNAGQYGAADTERHRLQVALARRGLSTTDNSLRVLSSTVCEPAETTVAPSTRVIDLRDPPTGWIRTNNLIVALPGKWTTAWQCADQVVEALTRSPAS
ncbi:FAD-dependent oxidoreductase [Actinoplanes sp. CA-015351]|uniref:FAD-dependent oxidoreductase n=1 Tax=Actinoplanes sp. CA-015351 TaxID=3239897 RepID=UPI003D974FAF